MFPKGFERSKTSLQILTQKVLLELRNIKEKAKMQSAKMDDLKGEFTPKLTHFSSCLYCYFSLLSFGDIGYRKKLNSNVSL